MMFLFRRPRLLPTIGAVIVPKVVFTANLRRHVDCPETTVAGESVREVLEAVFVDRPRLRGYVLDEQGRLRKHMAIFVDGRPIIDRETLSEAVREPSEIYVMQALSGG